MVEASAWDFEVSVKFRINGKAFSSRLPNNYNLKVLNGVAQVSEVIDIILNKELRGFNLDIERIEVEKKVTAFG